MTNEKKNRLQTAALEAVRTHPAKMSTVLLTHFLQGVQFGRLAEKGLIESPHFGSLEGELQGDIEPTILQAIAGGLMVEVPGYYAALRLTNAGEDVLNKAALQVDGVCPDAAYQAYYSWRRNYARDRKTPPYRIFPNAILISLANTCPTTLEELLLMGGLGARRINRFGDELLAVGRRLRNHDQEVTA